jgi:hypothetical protein
MSDWTTQYDAVFFISLATLMTGAFGVALRYCLRSKCEHCSICFGLFTIDRRVDLETQEHMREIELGINEDQHEIKHNERRPSKVELITEKKDNLENI